jgi:CBS domain-containing protein
MGKWGLSLVRSSGTEAIGGCTVGGHRSPDSATVADVMARDVIPVRRETPVHQVAMILLDRGLPGIPVVDLEDRVVGVLGEQDLLARLRPRGRRAWWQGLADDGDRLARECRRAIGMTAGEVMTHPAITASPTLPVTSAVLLFDDPRVGLLPVVAEGRLVGALSRRDLVKWLPVGPVADVWRSDADLVAEMQERMAQEPWVSIRRPVVSAAEGVLALSGLVRSEAEKLALETMASAIPGCRGVDSHLVAIPATGRGIM